MERQKEKKKTITLKILKHAIYLFFKIIYIILKSLSYELFNYSKDINFDLFFH